MCECSYLLPFEYYEIGWKEWNNEEEEEEESGYMKMRWGKEEWGDDSWLISNKKLKRGFRNWRSRKGKRSSEAEGMDFLMVQWCSLNGGTGGGRELPEWRRFSLSLSLQLHLAGLSAISVREKTERIQCKRGEGERENEKRRG